MILYRDPHRPIQGNRDDPREQGTVPAVKQCDRCTKTMPRPESTECPNM